MENDLRNSFCRDTEKSYFSIVLFAGDLAALSRIAHSSGDDEDVDIVSSLVYSGVVGDNRFGELEDDMDILCSAGYVSGLIGGKVKFNDMNVWMPADVFRCVRSTHGERIQIDYLRNIAELLLPQIRSWINLRRNSGDDLFAGPGFWSWSASM